MGRLDTRFSRPPVRIGIAAGAAVADTMLPDDLQRTSLGAGDYGHRERRYASVPLRLRIDATAGPNAHLGKAGTKPIGPTRRKRGYPPIAFPGESSSG
jgi:hypothetical protein